MAAEIDGAAQTVARQATAVAAETAEISGAAQTVVGQATAVAAEISGAIVTVAGRYCRQWLQRPTVQQQQQCYCNDQTSLVRTDANRCSVSYK